MRAALYNLLFLVAGTCPNVVIAQDLGFDEQAVKTFCAGEWKDDFAMQKFCIDQLASGHRDFGSLVSSENDGDMRQALKNCQQEWGVQWNMVSFCGEQQVNARSKLPTIFLDVPEDVATTIRKKCEAEWPVDFAMTAFCAEQNVSGWKQINE